MKKSYLFASILVLVTLYSNAQFTSNVNLNTIVKDSVGYEESVPLSATLSNGSTYVSYFAQYNGSYQMRLQLLDSSGNRLFGAVGLLISNQPQSTAIFRYDMKVDENDNAIIAFQDIRTAGNLNIVVYKIDKSGNFLWGANGIQLIDPVSVQGLAPAIGITNSGNVIIGWNASSSNNYKWVAFQKITSAGTQQWSTNLRVIDSSFVHKFSRQTFAPCGADDFIMLYADESGTGLPPSKMFAQRYDTGGNKVWANAVQVSTKTIPFFFFCKAVSDHQNGFYVGFNAANNANPSMGDVYMQHVDSSGNLWNASGNVACALANTQKFTPATHYDAATNKAWVLIKTTDVNQSMSGLAIQQFDSAGNMLLTANAKQLVPVSVAYHDPSDFCITDDGIISFYISGNYPNQTLNAIKNNFSGAIQWNGNPVAISTHSAGKDDLSSGLFANNQAVVVWTDNRNDYGVYAQNITNNGQLGIVNTALIEITNQNLFTVSPNPFTDKIHFEFNASVLKTNATVKIYNALGKKVFNENINEATNDISTFDWPTGVYFIKINNQVTKLIKN